jgi:hypothetical protein
MSFNHAAAGVSMQLSLLRAEACLSGSLARALLTSLSCVEEQSNHFSEKDGLGVLVWAASRKSNQTCKH